MSRSVVLKLALNDICCPFYVFQELSCSEYYMRVVIKYSFVVLFSALCPIVIMLLSDQMTRLISHSLNCASVSLNSARRPSSSKGTKSEKKSFADIIVGETARTAAAAALWTSLLNVTAVKPNLYMTHLIYSPCCFLPPIVGSHNCRVLYELCDCGGIRNAVRIHRVY
jgi:hypothetical protein